MIDDIKRRSLLTKRTSPGIFMTECSRYILWLFESKGFKVALQLNGCTDRPAFSYCVLGDSPIAKGLLIGPTKLTLNKGVFTNFTNRVGVIMCENVSYIKAVSPLGRSERIVINQNYNYPDHGNFEQWSLITEISGRDVDIFKNIEASPDLRPYSNSCSDIYQSMTPNIC